MAQSRKVFGYRDPVLYVPDNLTGEDLSSAIQKLADLDMVDVVAVKLILAEVAATREAALKASQPELQQKEQLLVDTREDLSNAIQKLVELGMVDVVAVNLVLAEVAARGEAALKASRSELQSSSEVKKELIKLSPEQKEQLFVDLRTNFEADMDLHPRLKWEDVAQKLKNSSETTLVTLHKMQARGGQPTVIDYDKKKGKYRFVDCSLQVPQEGRNTNYFEAEKMAQDMGAYLMVPKYYKNIFQKLGRNFDRYDCVWLKTYKGTLRTGYASYGSRNDVGVFVDVRTVGNHYGRGGFRVSLWV